VAKPSKSWVCDLSLAGFVGPNPAGGIGVCLLSGVLVRERPLPRADHSSRGILPNMVCLSVIVKPR